MKKQLQLLNNENGSLLVITLVLLMLLTIIGVAITTTTSIELQIAANDRIHKTTFYAADGGADLASELLEQNLGCMGGFSSDGSSDATNTRTGAGPGNGQPYADVVNVDDIPAGEQAENTFRVFDLFFWQRQSASQPSDTNRDAVFPAAAETDAAIPHTNITAGYNPGFSTGSAIQMVSGYEGKGKAVGSGGAFLLYQINSQHRGIANSQSTIQIQWRHVVGSEGACNY